jgi:cell volume regulation protein A
MDYEFLIIGLTIVMGFAATLVFERTRISQVIILMLFGFLLGPVFGLLDVSTGSVMVSILPFVATLALIVLLFDGGMEFDIFATAKAIPKSLLFTLLVFILSLIFVSLFAVLLLGWPLLHGALLGAVIGGVSSAVVITMVENTGLKKETKSLLTVESTMTDALCIITAVIIAQLIAANVVPTAGAVVNLLLSQFTIAILLGIVGAAIWVAIIDRFALHNYAYMLMLALVFIIFSVTESVQANGGVAVFVFGLLLGNARKIGKLANMKWEDPMNRMMRLFQEEVTFFVRTFFFVYVGLLLSLEYFTLTVIVISIGLVAILIIPRLITKNLVLRDLRMRDSDVVMSMMPRGLAAAVLATIPLTIGIKIPIFQELVFGVLLFSNVAATFGVYLFDRERPDEKNNGKKNNKKA